jgi:hypothetical protein
MRTTLILLLVIGVAHADDIAPAPRALVVHVAPTQSEPGAPVVLEAMIDAPYAETVVVRWRAIGGASWRDARFERSSSGQWFASIAPPPPPGLEYFIRGTDAAGAAVDHFASEAAPHQVHVEPTLYDRLEALDRRRLGDLDNEVAVDWSYHDFGNRYGVPDEFWRGEIAYTHRALRFLHEVGFGFGAIDGNTPDMSSSAASKVYRGLRYGFGQVRLRFDPSVFVDARVGLGASQDGFEGNVRGQLTLGKPWRSCVQLGGEYLGGLGPSAWVRLQWDTAPPLLMGASVVRSDLPGAMLPSRPGLYIAYDIAWRIFARVSLRGEVSYGSRDGGGAFGGGFGTAVAF